jgi:hypothetical protein
VWSKAGRFVEGLHLVGEILQPLKDKYLNYAFITFGMTVLFMYHVFRCVNELLLNAMACLIVAVTYIFYSEN